jgi:hypothetical protein
MILQARSISHAGLLYLLLELTGTRVHILRFDSLARLARGLALSYRLYAVRLDSSANRQVSLRSRSCGQHVDRAGQPAFGLAFCAGMVEAQSNSKIRGRRLH